MKIVVVGAGKVGYSLAQRLTQDQHDVYVIEKNSERIKNLENNLDVNLVQGNGSSISLLQEIGIEDMGMLIAVTSGNTALKISVLLNSGLVLITKGAKAAPFFSSRFPLIRSTL